MCHAGQRLLRDGLGLAPAPGEGCLGRARQGFRQKALVQWRRRDPVLGLTTTLPGELPSLCMQQSTPIVPVPLWHL